MKKVFFLFGLILLMNSCDKDINITQPTILIDNNAPYSVFDSIKVEVKEYAEVDGQRYIPNYYKWSIEDMNNNVIADNFNDSIKITWIPQKAQKYIIKVTIGYDNNKSITTLSQIEIVESVKSLQKRLIGNWIGDAETMFGLKWKIDIKFDSIGHYKGKVSGVSDVEYLHNGIFYGGVFYLSSHGVDNLQGGQMGAEPSEDVSCTRFLIKDIKNKLGYGILSTSYEYDFASMGGYQYGCTESLKIHDLTFSNNDSNLYFYLSQIGDISDSWYIKYNLIRK